MRALICVLALAAVILQGCLNSDSSPGVQTSTTTTTTTTTTSSTSTFPSGRLPPSPPPPSLIHELNAFYSSFNPQDNSSSLGVLASIGQISDFFPPCGEGECDPAKSSIPTLSRNCRVSGSLLSSLVGTWAGNCKIFLCGESGGWIYNYKALNELVKCSYVSDGASDGRANHGCGCEVATSCQQHPDFKDCANACKSLDPDTGKPYAPASDMLTKCSCKNDIRSPLTCYFEGPAFYTGTSGRDKTRQMQQARVEYQAEGKHLLGYSELILDWSVQDHLARTTGLSSIVSAFMLPINAKCGSGCLEQLLNLRDTVARRYGEILPIVTFNGLDNSAPFGVYTAELFMDIV